jgi:ArsR family transcriptional regulator, nickel/cobalt-responsive transcriptional repressor
MNASFSPIFFLVLGAHMTDPKQAKQCAEMLQAIAEPNRIRIIECLRAGSMNVTQLAKALSVEIVNVSHHLGVLRQAGLVQDEKNGRFVVYSLHPKIFNNDSAKATYLDLGWCRIEIPHN